MIRYVRLLLMSLLIASGACSTGQAPSASAPPGADPVLDEDVRAALAALYADTPKAKELADQAKGILVFPNVVKAGFIAGAEHGTGELIENGRVTGRFATTGLSYGLQAGVQTFGYVMLFMTDAALNNLKSSPGFEVGLGPSVVVVDQGVAKSLTTATLQSDIYAFIFNQKGLMAGLGLKGSKITRLN